MTTTTQESYSNWRAELQGCFEQTEEFLLASAIFEFEEAFARGLTAQQAFTAFDSYVRGDDV